MSRALRACSSTRSTAQPSSRSSVTAWRTASAASGARPSVGSSATNTLGGFASAGAKLNICCSPPELAQHWEAVVGALTFLCRRQQQAEVLLDRETGEHAARLGYEQEAGARASVWRLARDVVTQQRDATFSGGEQPRGDRAERGLTRAVRAEERDDPARRHIDADIVEHFDFAVAGHDVDQRERRLLMSSLERVIGTARARLFVL